MKLLDLPIGTKIIDIYSIGVSKEWELVNKVYHEGIGELVVLLSSGGGEREVNYSGNMPRGKSIYTTNDYLNTGSLPNVFGTCMDLVYTRFNDQMSPLLRTSLIETDMPILSTTGEIINLKTKVRIPTSGEVTPLASKYTWNNYLYKLIQNSEQYTRNTIKADMEKAHGIALEDDPEIVSRYKPPLYLKLTADYGTVFDSAHYSLNNPIGWCVTYWVNGMNDKYLPLDTISDYGTIANNNEQIPRDILDKWKTEGNKVSQETPKGFETAFSVNGHLMHTPGYEYEAVQKAVIHLDAKTKVYRVDPTEYKSEEVTENYNEVDYTLFM